MENIGLFSDLIDKIAVVTGGYGYLGRIMVDVLHSFGCKVYVLGRSKLKFEDTFGENHTRILFCETDLSDVLSIEKSINAIGKQEKKVDVLINNAYFGASNNPEKMTSEQWRLGVEGGLNQVFDCIKTAIPYLKLSRNGKIINISSMYGVTVPDLSIYEGREEFLNPPNYGTAKAGVIHLTKYYAMFLAQNNINVNAISPGPFPSNKVQEDVTFVKRLENKTKIGRLGCPEDLKGIVVLLSSSSSNYITGQNIVVDGGWTL